MLQVWQYITLTKRIYLIDCPGIVPASANDTQAAKVLKGVVRVEALPTPSEHIPTLMERVKPIYLSRTYGVPLPDEDDPSKIWDPEDFLNKLARMKGRLLKQGEPDLDGVAKIVLSDWVRGRIPYFVPPPERPEGLDQAEAKKRQRALKGKGKAVVDAELPGVKQNLKTLVQKNTFLPEDVQRLDEEEYEEEENSGVLESADESDVEAEEDEDDNLKWNDVFEGIPVVPEAVREGISMSSHNILSVLSLLTFHALDGRRNSDSEDENSLPQKEPRMKTSKVGDVTVPIHTS